MILMKSYFIYIIIIQIFNFILLQSQGNNTTIVKLCQNEPCYTCQNKYCFSTIEQSIKSTNRRSLREKLLYIDNSNFSQNKNRKLLQQQISADTSTMTILQCLQRCYQSNATTSWIWNVNWIQKTNTSPCLNCSIDITAGIDLKEFFNALNINQDTIVLSTCKFTSSLILNLPDGWNIKPYLRDKLICKFYDEVSNTINQINDTAIQVNLTMKHLNKLFTYNNKNNKIYPLLSIIGISSPTILSSSNISSIFFFFESTGCVLNQNGLKQILEINVPFSNKAITTIGKFSDVTIIPDNYEILAETSLNIKLRAGAPFTTGSSILFNSNQKNNPVFYNMLQSVTNVILIEPYKTNLKYVLGETNFSILFSEELNDKIIESGEYIYIIIKNIKNPDNIYEKPGNIRMTGLAQQSINVDDISIDLYEPLQAHYGQSINKLDTISMVLFALCLLISLIIVRWHGIHFTRMTIWTDMVAISAVLSFKVSFIAYVAWLFYPSSLFIYLNGIQYFFNAVMILSLCFHWGSVLALKLFKKITIKSPVVIGYISTLAIALSIIIILLTTFNKSLECIFHDNALKCDSKETCAIKPFANGQVVRNATAKCHMNVYYIILASVFIVYTLLLMILGCLVMNRGRSIMMSDDHLRLTSLSNNHNNGQIRSSLTIFYIIISTTCVLYISAEIIYIVQSTSGAKDLSDTIWYLFIVWLPQCLPPLLLLFLQWNPTTANENMMISNSIVLSENRIAGIPVLTSSSSTEEDFRDSSLYTEIHSHKKNENNHRINNTFLTDDPDFDPEQLINTLPLIIRLTLPSKHMIKKSNVNDSISSCFITLEYCKTDKPLQSERELKTITKEIIWKNVGSTEEVQIHETNLNIPFVTVFELPVIGLSSQTLLRFILRYINNLTLPNTKDNTDLSLFRTTSSVESINSSTSLCEFITTVNAIEEAAANNQSLNIRATVLDNTTIDTNINHTILSVQTIIGNRGNSEIIQNNTINESNIYGNTDPNIRNSSHNHKFIGNITRFFQYDTQDGMGGLVVEELQETSYSNCIPRQLLELLVIERKKDVEKAKKDLTTFISKNKKKYSNNMAYGFYGALIGKIQDEGDTMIIREYLEKRLKNRKNYIIVLNDHINYIKNSREKNNKKFKASVDKKKKELAFIPINLHIEDLLIGPTSAFVNDIKRKDSTLVSIYDFTTVGAMAAHTLNFNKGGMLSIETKLNKLRDTIKNDHELNSNSNNMKWSEDVRNYDDLQWDLMMRKDICFSQALTALVTSFTHKIDLALSNTIKGDEILNTISTSGFLFQVESLLSTHGKEVGMLEDMAAAISLLSKVTFILQDVKDRPTGRFSFRLKKSTGKDKDLNHSIHSTKQDDSLSSNSNSNIVKVQLYSGTYDQIKNKNKNKNNKSICHKEIDNENRNKNLNININENEIKYCIIVQVSCTDIFLPERLMNGGHIQVIPLLFTQGINEMQTIANSTERSKTEIQEMINSNNIKILKNYCENYIKLSTMFTVLPPLMITNEEIEMDTKINDINNNHYLNNKTNYIRNELKIIETLIYDASQAIVKTKKTEILTKTSDLCRTLGAGRVTVCKSAKDRTAMSITLEQGRILHQHHHLPLHKIPATVSIMRSHGVRIENAYKNTGKRQYAFNKIQRSLLPEDYRCPESVGGSGNVS